MIVPFLWLGPAFGRVDGLKTVWWYSDVICWLDGSFTGLCLASKPDDWWILVAWLVDLPSELWFWGLETFKSLDDWPDGTTFNGSTVCSVTFVDPLESGITWVLVKRGGTWKNMVRVFKSSCRAWVCGFIFEIGFWLRCSLSLSLSSSAILRASAVSLSSWSPPKKLWIAEENRLPRSTKKRWGGCTTLDLGNPNSDSVWGSPLVNPWVDFVPYPVESRPRS